jgi:O-antigen/teichoic acid export membrane protein
MKQDEFKTRYFIKLLSSVFIAVLNAVVQFILPRAFSVEEYGYYSYNLNMFNSIVVLANLSASNALVSKFSKRNEEIGIVRFYLVFYLIETLALSVAIIILFSLDIISSTFIGQTLMMVLLGIEYAALNKLLSDVIGIYDSMAVSRVPAVSQIVLKVFLSVYVVSTYILGKLNLIIFYVGQIVIIFSVVSILLFLILRYQKAKYPNVIDRGLNVYLKEYFEYCHPLVMSSMLSQLLVVFMNWSLMHWSGAVQSAVFGVAWQLNTLVAYVFSPYAELSKREFAVACGDDARLRGLFEKSLKLMIWITAYFAYFIGVCGDWIIPIMYGNKYSSATVVTFLIMVYTVYQAWGQIIGSFMLAIEETKLSAGLSVVQQILTLILVFIFQIPNFIWPDGLGAVGIALVYMLTNFIATNLRIVCLGNLLQMSKFKILNIQILPNILCVGTAYILHMIFNNVFFTDSLGGRIIAVFITGILYTLCIVIIILIRPQLIGMSNTRLNIFRRKKS